MGLHRSRRSRLPEIIALILLALISVAYIWAKTL